MPVHGLMEAIAGGFSCHWQPLLFQSNCIPHPAEMPPRMMLFEVVMQNTAVLNQNRTLPLCLTRDKCLLALQQQALEH